MGTWAPEGKPNKKLANPVPVVVGLLGSLVGRLSKLALACVQLSSIQECRIEPPTAMECLPACFVYAELTSQVLMGFAGRLCGTPSLEHPLVPRCPSPA
jgi:hypothetical protein